MSKERPDPRWSKQRQEFTQRKRISSFMAEIGEVQGVRVLRAFSSNLHEPITSERAKRMEQYLSDLLDRRERAESEGKLITLSFEED